MSFAAEGRIRNGTPSAAEGRIRKWDAIFAAEGRIRKWDAMFISLLRRQKSQNIKKYWEIHKSWKILNNLQTRLWKFNVVEEKNYFKIISTWWRRIIILLHHVEIILK